MRAPILQPIEPTVVNVTPPLSPQPVTVDSFRYGKEGLRRARNFFNLAAAMDSNDTNIWW